MIGTELWINFWGFLILYNINKNNKENETLAKFYYVLAVFSLAIAIMYKAFKAGV